MSNRSRHRKRSMEKEWARVRTEIAQARSVLEEILNREIERKFPEVAKDYTLRLKEPEEL